MAPPRKRARDVSSDESEEEKLESINPNDVTVAIFCALAYESVAVKYTLDEELDCSTKTTGRGSYVYSFGWIQEHNVVIARPVDMGPVNAAQCAATVSQQFVNVRFALMVGIGAGIPSEKVDIRLGDVVISVPRDNHPGVIQYDFGKYESGDKFTRKGTLNMAPRLLISAIGSLEEDEMMDKNPIKRILRRLVKLNNFARPTDDDKLFAADFSHKEIGSDCSACHANSNVKIVARSERANPDEPVIHRGLVLSGGGVIKDPKVRDRLRRDCQDAICLEMEAAGIMNEIPCLVIRGICDYADTHKQDGWHHYAAAVAASYCKAVLLKVPGDEVTDIAPMREMVSQVNVHLDNLNTKFEGLKHDADLEKIRHWLSPPDPSTNLNKARELHQERTGEWLIQGEKYLTWKHDPNSFLWLNGIPGCGKTKLSSSVVTELKQDPTISPSLVYFYFDFNDVTKQSHEKLLSSLIAQLYEQRPDLRETVNALHKTCSSGAHKPSAGLLGTKFQDMIKQASGVWIVLDALDECPIRSGLLTWIADLQSADLDIHLMVTSRPEQEIKTVIESFSCGSRIINMQNNMVRSDINAYVKRRTKMMDRWRNHPEVQREIETALTDKADGMFRWAACQFDVLNKCLDRPSILRQLENLPTTLSETYTRILQNIEKEYHHHTKRLLQFILYSEEPLMLEEAVDALAVDTTAPRHLRFDISNRMPVPEEILRCCSSLVVLFREDRPIWPHQDNNSRKLNTFLRFAHYSVQEYLLSDQIRSINPTISESFSEIAARTEIADVCLAYLLNISQASILELCKQARNGGDIRRAVFRNYHMAEYCATHWAEHAMFIEQTTYTTAPSVKEFLSFQEAVNLSSLLHPAGTMVYRSIS